MTRAKTNKRRLPLESPAPLTSPRNSWRRNDWLSILILSATTLLTYAPVLDCDLLNYDDDQYITENAFVQAGLNTQSLYWAWTTTHAANWHPLTWLSLMLDTHLFGLHPWGYHLTNLLLHLANTLLLFALLRWSTGATLRSFLAAALFSLHPLHVQSVAWASERKDVLSTFFGLLALLAYVHYVRSPRVMRYLLVMVATALSLLAKPMLVTLPFVLCLFDYWPLDRWQPGQTKSAKPASHRAVSLRWLLMEKVPPLILSVVFSTTTIWAQQRGGRVSSLEAFSLSTRIGNALISYVQYLRQTVWPADLALFYPLKLGGPSVLLAAMSGLLIITVTTVVIRWRRNYPYLLVGWLFYLGTLVPVVGLIQVGVQARADRYTYVPLIGIFTAASWGMADLATAIDRRRLFGYLVGAIFFPLMLTSWTEAHYWHDSLTLWNHTLEVTQNNYGAHVGRGFALLRQGNEQLAEEDFRDAQRLAPGLAEPHYGLGFIRASRGEYTEAMQLFREALAIRPEYPEAYNDLGVCLLRQNKRGEAISCFQQALRLSPDWPRAQNNLRFALNAENRKSPE
jgi:hypothetical protein